MQKSTFENWTFAQFLSFKWRNGFQNRNVLKKLSGTGPFWKFWLFGQDQGSTWSKHFLFLFFFYLKFFAAGSDWVRFPSRSGSNRVSLVKPGSGGWCHPWRHAQRAHVSAWRVECVRGLRLRVTAREKTLVIAGPSGGAWRRMAGRFDLKFSSLVDLRPLKIKV